MLSSKEASNKKERKVERERKKRLQDKMYYKRKAEKAENQKWIDIQTPLYHQQSIMK